MGFVDSGYWAPQCLYSRSSIRKLSLIGCIMKIQGNVQWHQLKCLTVEGVCLSENVINQVLSSAPQLEALTLHLMESEENLNIRSSSLKMVMIEKYYDEKGDLMLTIWAPNVETLEIFAVLSKCVLMNVSSLARVLLGFEVPEDHDYGRFFHYKLHEEILGQVYHMTRHVEKVTLSDGCFKVLGEMKKKNKDILAPLLNTKFLKVYAREVDKKIVGLLKIFPMLTMLVLEERDFCVHGFDDIFEIHWGGKLLGVDNRSPKIVSS